MSEASLLVEKLKFLKGNPEELFISLGLFSNGEGDRNEGGRLSNGGFNTPYWLCKFFRNFIGNLLRIISCKTLHENVYLFTTSI